MVEIAFKTIAELVIALFAVGFLLMILSAMLPGVASNTYCAIGNSISALPIPSFIKPSMDQCGLQVKSKKQTIEQPFDDAKLSQFLMECWKNNGEGHGGLTHDCYELFLLDVPVEVSESTLTDYMIKNGLCENLQDNFLEAQGEVASCGNLNQILWKYPGEGNQPTSISGSEVTVLIKYNAFDHRIEII
jgi:hypothetical protein